MSFFSWWYGNGWRQVIQSLGPRIRNVTTSFSVGQLASTIFAPWKRIITPPGRSLEDRARAAVDNAFSRMIGFIVRLFVLLVAFVSIVAVVLFTIIEMLAWPLLPLAVPGFIIAGIVL